MQKSEAILYLVFVPFSFSGNNTLIQDSEVQQERATYNCPWEKTGVCKSNPTFATDCPWDLLMVIAKASWTGNWWHLNFTGISSAEGSNDILGIKTVFPHLHQKIGETLVWPDSYDQSKSGWCCVIYNYHKLKLC